MTVDDLDDREVRTQYDVIVDRNPSYKEQRREIETTLSSDETVLEDAETRVRRALHREKKHDELLTSAISAFLPGGEIHETTGWTFRGAEPLSERNESNADAIFCNPDRNIALLLECKTSGSSPGGAINQLVEARDAVREYADELADHIEMEIEEVEMAICVPSYHDQRMADQIEREIIENELIDGLYLWRWHNFDENERIDLFTSFGELTNAQATHDNQLAEVLSQGVDIAKERQVTPSFYPSSHSYHIFETIAAELLKQRSRNDEPLREFAAQEIRELVTSQRHLPHYDANSVGERIFSGLVERLEDYTLISQIEPEDTELTEDDEFYRFTVRGRSIDTVLRNLRDKYREKSVERQIQLEAMREVIQEFNDDQSKLDDFFD